MGERLDKLTAAAAIQPQQQPNTGPQRGAPWARGRSRWIRGFRGMRGNGYIPRQPRWAPQSQAYWNNSQSAQQPPWPPMDAVTPHQQTTWPNLASQQPPTACCGRCGLRAHATLNSCPAINESCHICGRMGHLMMACGSAGMSRGGPVSQ